MPSRSEIVPSRIRRPAGRGGEGIQPPLLVQITNEDQDPSPPLAREDENRGDRRQEIEAMAKLLKSLGVMLYWPLARDYPAALIEAKVEEWEGSGLGPGMLVQMIQAGGPVVDEEPWWREDGQLTRWAPFIERGERPPPFATWLPGVQERCLQAIAEATAGAAQRRAG